ncbi:MAG: phosphate signaling complex protein PhoU [Planctomycetota bacterium]|jgi:phosphate transport system protein
MPANLQVEVTDLRRAILTMAASVEQRVARAVRSLTERDHELAQGVRTGDPEIDRMEVDIESECLRILALIQPVARDLRFVMAVLRMNTDLERTGDLAKGIAKRVLDLETLPPTAVPSILPDMASAALQMFRDAVTALANEDVDLCRRIRHADDTVDEKLRELLAWAQQEMPRKPEAARAVIDVLSVARKLERIGDMATNIAEDVVFAVEGSIIRHTEA